MTGPEMADARAALGDLWGLGRPLRLAEMGRALGLRNQDPGQSISDYERGRTKVSGTMAVLVSLYLRGILPPDGVAAISAPEPKAYRGRSR